MARQVEVTAVVDALELLPAEREAVLDVDRLLRVVGELVGGVLPEAEPRRRHAVARVPVEAARQPLLEDRRRLGRLDEVLHLHLLELAHPEDEVAGLISFRNDFPIWAIPNGIFLRELCWTFLKLTYEPWAVSGRK